mmetsp:Transcript_28312/g.71012  ORF Transcript_28312/g.71012 Transcript_28312/m.71012 type:complete len:335 (+) Transcript_28312:2394-3398(+)
MGNRNFLVREVNQRRGLDLSPGFDLDHGKRLIHSCDLVLYFGRCFIGNVSVGGCRRLGLDFIRGHGFIKHWLGFDDGGGIRFDDRELDFICDDDGLSFDNRGLSFDYRDLGFDNRGLGFDKDDGLGFDDRGLGFNSDNGPSFDNYGLGFEIGDGLGFGFHCGRDFGLDCGRELGFGCGRDHGFDCWCDFGQDRGLRIDLDGSFRVDFESDLGLNLGFDVGSRLSVKLDSRRGFGLQQRLSFDTDLGLGLSLLALSLKYGPFFRHQFHGLILENRVFSRGLDAVLGRLNLGIADGLVFGKTRGLFGFVDDHLDRLVLEYCDRLVLNCEVLLNFPP